MEILKTYEYGYPSLIGSVEYDDYRLALIIAGERLVVFWDTRVKSYFSRSDNSSMFTKGGKFRLISPNKRSVLKGALTAPSINSRGMGILGLKNVVKQNEDGSTVQLIKLLMTGADEQFGIHYDPFSGVMEKGGKWKGFPASYWRRWDTVFTKQCKAEGDKITEYVKVYGKRSRYTDEDGNEFDGSGDVVKAFMSGRIKSVGGVVGRI